MKHIEYYLDRLVRIIYTAFIIITAIFGGITLYFREIFYGILILRYFTLVMISGFLACIAVWGYIYEDGLKKEQPYYPPTLIVRKPTGKRPPLPPDFPLF